MIEPGCIIDGAIPREPWERCETLLAAATDYSAELQRLNTDPRFQNLEQDIAKHRGDKDWEFWNEVEDDIVDLIEDILPTNYCIDMEAGDVVLMTEDA